MSEEILKRIAKLETKLYEIDSEISSLRSRIWLLDFYLSGEYVKRREITYSLRVEYGRKGGLTAFYRRLIRRRELVRAREVADRLDAVNIKIEYLMEERYDTDRSVHDKLDEISSLETKIAELQIERKRLQDELDELKKKLIIKPEFIDIDEETGYLIFYDVRVKKYFKVRTEDYKVGKIEVVKHFKSLEISVVFAFDTETVVKYPGQAARWLAAEVRITVRVQEAGKKLADAIPVKLKLAFEHFITMFFEQARDRGKGAGKWKWGMTHRIADGLEYVGDHEIEVAEEIRKMLGVAVLKVGVFYRVSDEQPNMVIEDEFCKADVTGEWSRENYSENISEEFDVEEELGLPLHWSKVRHTFAGETGWEQLKKVMKGEEENE